MNGKAHRTGCLTMCVIGLALAYQILVPPIVGLANNGDYAKVSGLFFLDWPKQDDFRYVVTRCPFGPGAYWISGFHTSEVLIAGAAMMLNRTITKAPQFDLRCIGAVHAGLFLAAIALFLPVLAALRRDLRIITCICLGVLLSDAFYATYFNSFFMDAGAIVFFVLVVAFYVRVRRCPTRIHWAALISFSVLFLTTKPQHAVLCLPIAGLLAWRFWCGESRRMAVVTGAAILCAGAASFIFGAPQGYAPLNTFNVIFLKILPSARTPAAELEELGLDASFTPYIGMYAYWPNSPTQDPNFVRDFGRRTSHAKIGWFFLRHPARAYRVLREALNEAGRIRPPLGNFERNTGLPEFTETQAFTFASGFKRAVLEGHGSRYLFLFLFLGIGLLAVSDDMAGALALVITGLIAMMVAGLGDAVDHARHFALFHVIVDVMIIAIAAAGSHRWTARTRRLRRDEVASLVA